MPELQLLRQWLERGWYAARPRLVLRPLAALYGLAVAARRWAYRRGWLASHHAGVPTVVIGNLTVGGTGKTPLVIWLAERLLQRGRNPGIALRGYGGRQRQPRLVAPEDDPGQVGDEAVLLACRTGCRVAVGADRALAASLLERAGCDLVIADDGLQHLAMRRDLEVIVIDGARGHGNGSLLPAGPLREPAARMHDAAFLVMHGEDRHGVLPAGTRVLEMQLEALPLRHLASGREAPLQGLRGRRVHALAGIGRPQRFFDQLRGLGIDPIEHPRPDHHRYTDADLAFGDDLPIVMTEKDAVKCAALASASEAQFYLPVAAMLPEDEAASLLDRIMTIRGGGKRA